MRVPQWPLPNWMVGATLLSNKQLADHLRNKTNKLVDAGYMQAIRDRNLNFEVNNERAVIIEAARRLTLVSSSRA